MLKNESSQLVYTREMGGVNESIILQGPSGAVRTIYQHSEKVGHICISIGTISD